MILPSPLGNKVGYFNHVGFRGYFSVHFRSGLQTSSLRFAGAVTGHHARLGTQLLAKLYCGCHLRPLYLMRLQGAIPTPPYMRVPAGGGQAPDPRGQMLNHSSLKG